MSGLRSPLWGGVLPAVGAGFVAVHVGFLLDAESARVAVASTVSVVLSAGLLVFGLTLLRDARAGYAYAVVRGAAVGAGVMAGVVVLAVEATPGPPIAPGDLPQMAADLLAVGTALGVVLGVYDARSRRERHRAEALFANLPIPTAYVERVGDDRVVRATNDAFGSAFGPSGSHDGRPLADCVPDPVDDRPLSTAIADGPRGRFRCAATATHGAREFVVTPVPAGVPDRMYVTLADVTEDRHRERRLSVLNRVLRHDLRSGLNVALGRAELLADDPGDEHLAAIRRRVESLVATSDRVRTLDRQLAGGTESRTVDLAAVVADRLDARAAGDGPPTVERSLPDRRVVVREDGLVGAVLDELLDNAAEHAGPTPTATVSVDATDGTARLTVADDGPGIPACERAVLEGVRETDLDHASGLGLWFVRWVVAELGGDVTVATGDDGPDGPAGTVVTVRFPLATDAEASARPVHRV